MDSPTVADGDVIVVCTREAAIEDGYLVDLSAAAPDVCRQHYRYPIACTAAVWALVQRALDSPGSGPDVRGVVHEILWMSRGAGRAIDASMVVFEVIIGEGQAPHAFKLVCGPGDQGEPVLTLMLPWED